MYNFAGVAGGCVQDRVSGLHGALRQSGGQRRAEGEQAEMMCHHWQWRPGLSGGLEVW